MRRNSEFFHLFFIQFLIFLTSVMHMFSAADFPLFYSNSARQNARLKNRLLCSKFCRQNLPKPTSETYCKAASEASILHDAFTIKDIRGNFASG